MSAVHDAYAALRYRDYRFLLASGVLSALGLEAQAVAVGWELYERTESFWLLGFAGLAQFLPVLLFALVAGQTADRYSRQRQFQLALAGQVLASVGLVALSFWQGPAELVLVFLFVSGVARAFAAPARTALLPQVVPLADLSNAVTWNSSGWQFANVTGPALGGLLLTIAPPWVVYGSTALILLLCIVLLQTLRPRQLSRPPVQRSLAGLLDGARFLARTPLLLAAITLDLFAVLLGGAVALLPVFARDILQVGPEGLGLLRTAPALGALAMGMWLAHHPLHRPGVALLLGVAGFGLATIGFGLSQNFYLSILLLALTGAFDNISVVVRGTLMQMLTPDKMRGRVAAINSVFISSSNELGAFESGVTAALFGPVLSVVGGGIGTLLIVGLILARWPMLLQLGPLHQLREIHDSKAEQPVSVS